MNPTDSDIRLALRERAQDATAAADVLPRLTSRTTRRTGKPVRHAVTLASAVAGVAAVAVVATLVANSQGARHAAAPTPAPSSTEPPASTTHPAPAPRHFDPRSFYFRLAPIPAATITQYTSAVDSQWMSIDQNARSVAYQSGWVLLWSADASAKQKPHRPAGARDVLVNNRPGFYGLITFAGELQPGLVWQYAPNAWGMVIGASMTMRHGKPTGISLADALTWAKAVRPAEPQAIRYPARFGYLPAGLSCWEIDPATKSSALPPDPTSGPAPTRISGHPSGSPVTLPAPPPVDPARLSAGVVLETTATPTSQGLDVQVRGAAWPHQNGTSVVVGGRPGTWNAKAHVLEVYGRDYAIRLASVNLAATPYSQAELTKIAESMAPAASFTDQSTWFDARSALP